MPRGSSGGGRCYWRPGRSTGTFKNPTTTTTVASGNLANTQSVPANTGPSTSTAWQPQLLKQTAAFVKSLDWKKYIWPSGLGASTGSNSSSSLKSWWYGSSDDTPNIENQATIPIPTTEVPPLDEFDPTQFL